MEANGWVSYVSSCLYEDMPHQNTLKEQTRIDIASLYDKFLEVPLLMNRSHLDLGTAYFMMSDFYRYRKSRQGIEVNEIDENCPEGFTVSPDASYHLSFDHSTYVQRDKLLSAVQRIGGRVEKSCGGRPIAKRYLVDLVVEVDSLIKKSLISENSPLSSLSTRSKIISDLVNWNFRRQFCDSSYTSEQIRQLLKYASQYGVTEKSTTVSEITKSESVRGLPFNQSSEDTLVTLPMGNFTN